MPRGATVDERITRLKNLLPELRGQLAELDRTLSGVPAAEPVEKLAAALELASALKTSIAEVLGEFAPAEEPEPAKKPGKK